jgi:hypothetical protein
MKPGLKLKVEYLLQFDHAGINGVVIMTSKKVLRSMIRTIAV